MSDNETEQDEIIESTLALAGVAFAATMVWKIVGSFLGQGNKNEAHRLFEEAVQFERKGMYNEAIQSYLKSIEKNPQYSHPYNAVAWNFAIHNYELDQALRYIHKAIELADNPGDLANFYDTLGEICCRKGDLNSAIVAFQKCLNNSNFIDQEYPDYSPSFRLGLCYLAKQDLNNALLLLNRALEVEPKNPHVHSTIGDVCLALERYTSALDYYHRSIKLSTDWNFNFPIVKNSNTDQPRQMFISICWCNMGAAFYNLEDYESCRCNPPRFRTSHN